MPDKKTNDKICINWKIRCLNTDTKSFFDKTRVLDVGNIPDDKLSDIINLCVKSSYSDILKHKEYFKETSKISGDEKAKECYIVCIPGYFEDQDGNALEEFKGVR